MQTATEALAGKFVACHGRIGVVEGEAGSEKEGSPGRAATCLPNGQSQW